MNKFVVSARKYRPSSFDEVIGQDHVAKTLKNALQTGQLAHSFLFTGPRGVGKTTCARILAKVINCENPINKTEACNKCNSCISFADNASFNILELDAASNNSVENIRSLIEQVRFRPQEGKYKIFIIDEVHMLSQAAFNAFLKTLEEPPEYAIFILATTEKHKIIPTILSRCQIFDFKRIQIEDAVIQLQKICEAEGRKAEHEALHTIAVKADGAMRDALSIFDKVASSAGETITYKDVIANLNLLDYEYYFKVTDAFLREDFNDVLLTLNEVIRLGFDPEQFVQGLADHLREVMIAKDPSTIQMMEASDDLKIRYQNQALLAKSAFLLSALNILNQCDINLPRVKNRRLHVEIALSKISYLSRLVQKDLVSGEPQEKKTEVVREPDSVIISTPVNNEEVQPNSNQKSTENAESTDITSEIISPHNDTFEHQEKQTAQPKPPASIPGLSNIEAIKKSIADKEASKAESRKNLNIDAVKEIWKSYTELNPSKSVQTALGIALLDLDGKVIKVDVPTTISRDMILQESQLVENLRNQLGTADLILNVTVNKDLFPDYEDNRPVQAMTQREKYILMLEKNPGLGLLSKKIELKLDAEIM
ncbi:MAG: DNA polymerase III subunit gamma/tau [Saprospiraceae bacterium]|nr:DNA polymerase III subunit gamma/tau [Saprospiraceae bacterium]